MTRYSGFGSLLLLSAAWLHVVAQEMEASGGLRSGVFMGMKLETIDRIGDATRVVATGAEFVIEKPGLIRCFQRIPERREIGRASCRERV